MSDLDPEQLRLVEAILFAAAEPVAEASLSERLGEGVDLAPILDDLRRTYSARGVNLIQVAGKWAFRTAPDLAALFAREREVSRKLSRAAIETLAIIAYHQPVTRAEIEEVRGVSLSRGTLDSLLEVGWIKPGRRRNAAGRPGTWISTEAFLNHFGLDRIEDLPGIDELRAAGLLDVRPAGVIAGVAEAGPEAEPPAEDEADAISDAPLTADDEPRDRSR